MLRQQEGCGNGKRWALSSLLCKRARVRKSLVTLCHLSHDLPHGMSSLTPLCHSFFNAFSHTHTHALTLHTHTHTHAAPLLQHGKTVGLANLLILITEYLQSGEHSVLFFFCLFVTDIVTVLWKCSKVCVCILRKGRTRLSEKNKSSQLWCCYYQEKQCAGAEC